MGRLLPTAPAPIVLEHHFRRIRHGCKSIHAGQEPRHAAVQQHRLLMLAPPVHQRQCLVNRQTLSRQVCDRGSWLVLRRLTVSFYKRDATGGSCAPAVCRLLLDTSRHTGGKKASMRSIRERQIAAKTKKLSYFRHLLVAKVRGAGRARSVGRGCGQRWAGGALGARLHFCVHAPPSLSGNAGLGCSRAFWSPSL